MEKNYGPSVEKRARSMFEDSRRGGQLFTQWFTLTIDQRNDWRDKALHIEQAITKSLKVEA